LTSKGNVSIQKPAEDQVTSKASWIWRWAPGINRNTEERGPKKGLKERNRDVYRRHETDYTKEEFFQANFLKKAI